MTNMTFSQHELTRLKTIHPTAKHFVYVKLPEDKELSFIVTIGASLKKGMKDQLGHLKKEHGYSDSDMEIESYDLRGIKPEKQPKPTMVKQPDGGDDVKA